MTRHYDGSADIGAMADKKGGGVTLRRPLFSSNIPTPSMTFIPYMIPRCGVPPSSVWFLYSIFILEQLYTILNLFTTYSIF